MVKDTREPFEKPNRQNTDNSSHVSSSSHIEINHLSHQKAHTGRSDVDGGALQTKVDELTADLQRIQADFVNFRRRSDDERGEFLSLAKQDVIIQLLPLLDNIGRALDHVPEELADNPWAKGVSQIAKQSEEILRGLGVEAFGKVGEPFDPNLHEAIGYETGEGDEEMISEVLQSGYKLGQKVIRHAMVKVSRK